MGYRFNPFRGTMDITSSSSSASTGFSQYIIASGDSVTIPEKFEMAVTDTIYVEGTLIVEGRLVIRTDDNNFKKINLYGE